MTTRQKIVAVIDALRSTPPDELSGQGKEIVELLQIAQGFGIDVLGMLTPASDADADELVDSLITMLLQLRGDDLPAYDFGRYGEAALDELDAGDQARELEPGADG